MARNEQDREDLIAEATALVDRIEVQLPNSNAEASDIVVAGFRSNRFLSIYFGQDRHYQFDGDGRLRRAFVTPYLFRAAHGKLSRLNRLRSVDQTILERIDLDAQQAQDFIKDCQRQLNVLRSLLHSNDLNVLRFVLSDEASTTADLLSRLETCLRVIRDRAEDFFSRTIKGKRLK